jgi:hypothetical protein
MSLSSYVRDDPRLATRHEALTRAVTFAEICQTKPARCLATEEGPPGTTEATVVEAVMCPRTHRAVVTSE